MLTTDDGVRLHYEEAGSGTPIVFVHEFAGDARSWEPQVRHFSRRYRCIAYCARGYPPSEVPESFERYSQERARDDIRSVLDGLKIERAHIVGLSMGANATLHFGLTYPRRVLSLTFAGGGYGSSPATRMAKRWRLWSRLLSTGRWPRLRHGRPRSPLTATAARTGRCSRSDSTPPLTSWSGFYPDPFSSRAT